MYHHEFSQLKEKDEQTSFNDEELYSNMKKSNLHGFLTDGLKYAHMHIMNSSTKLKSYLEVLEDVNRIKHILTVLLGKNEESVQLLVLKQLLKLKIPEFNKYKKSLLAFNSDTDFKDEVIKFPLSTLTEQERKVLLPYIIRMLNSKLLKKRGKANRKSIVTRRKIVYKFLAELKNEDLDIFIRQAIEPFNLTLEDTKDPMVLESKLSQCGFTQYLGYISALDGIVSQMGSLIQDYLPYLCNVLLAIFKISKKFFYRARDTQGPIDDEVEDSENEEDDNGKKDSEHQNVSSHTLSLCRTVFANTFKKINLIYEKYFYLEYIKNDFSQEVMIIYKENIENLHTQNISSKSALMETFLTWSKHLNLHGLFLQFNVVDQLCKIISYNKDIVHFEVYSMIFTILRNIVISGLSSNEEELDKRDTIINLFRKQEDEDGDAEMSNSDSIEIISSKYGVMITSISDFLQYNWEIIKNGVLNKKEKKEKGAIDKRTIVNVLTKDHVFRSPSFIKNVVLVSNPLKLSFS